MSFLSELKKKAQAKNPQPIVNKPDPQTAQYLANMFAWGYGEYGRLGQGDKTTYDLPMQVLSYVDVKFSTVALGAAHCLAISNGQLYTWGKCHVGQLGHGEEFSDEYVPRLVEKPKDVKFVQVSSGDSHSLAITDQGELYVFGIGYYGALGLGSESHVFTPTLLEFFKTAGLRVKEAHGGEFHTIVLTDNGEVYTWGRNDYGQLGIGETVNSAGATMYLNSRVPQKVNGLDGVKIIKVACGYNHCLALSDKGEVYAWGRNTYSQLGDSTLDLTKKYSEPVKVPFAEPVLDINSKKHWNLATTANHLYVWGKNKGGRIAGKDVNANVPTIVQAFEGKKIVSMSAGYSHAIVATDDGACYTWGFNEFGKLGREIASVADGVTPTRVQYVLKSNKVVQVAAGSNSCLVLAEP